MPFDVREIRPDALIVGGYKCLLVPYSIGTAYYGSRFDGGVPLEENWIARERSEVFDGLVNYQSNYHPGAIRYDVGERSNFILVPMLLASLGLILEWDPKRIQKYCRQLGNIFIKEARSIGFLLEEEKWRSSHLFGVQLPKRFDPTSIKNKLEDHNIFVSRRANALRISLHVYNDENDLEALLDALRAFA
jgi:selenocysteine lyase/cysteine desulfurase